MKFALATHNANNGSTETFMQIRELSVPNGASDLSVIELELSATHTVDLNHVDFSGPDCLRVRAQLASMAESALEHVAEMQPGIGFKVYTDRSITCSQADGQRPCVTVSIYIWDRPGVAMRNDACIATSQVQRALASLGVHSR